MNSRSSTSDFTFRPMHRRKSPLSINLETFVLSIVLSSAPTLRAEVKVRQDANTVILSNEKVELKFDTHKRSFSITNPATGEVVLDGAKMSANGSESRKQDGKGWLASQRLEEVEDAFGKGRRLVVSLSVSRFPAVPTYLFSYTHYEGHGAVFMGFGMHNTRDFDLRLMDSQPMAKATLLPGRKIEQVMTLNGSAGAEKAEVKPGATRESANSLLLTCTVGGQRQTGETDQWRFDSHSAGTPGQRRLSLADRLRIAMRIPLEIAPVPLSNHPITRIS